MMMLMSGGVRTLIGRGRSSSPLIYSLFSSSSSTSSPSASELVTAGAATDVSGEDLLLEDSPPSAAVAAKAAIPSLLQPGVVVYDGVCHLCHKGVKWVIQADKHRKIKFCCLQSKAAEPYMRLCGVDREDVLRRFLFIEGPGLYHQGSTAALRVMSYLPLPYSTLSTLLVVPTPLRDVVYDYVAKRRYDWFGKEEDCLVLQETELLERFIDREEMLDRSQSDL
uniref:Thiol-disulfide oxidoreductase DCC n=1 Tax=Davidia involucrata TaxID=16924 RepID=A0A5B7BXL9_DAVIN